MGSKKELPRALEEFKIIFDGGECRGVHCFPRRIRRRRRRRPSRIRI